MTATSEAIILAGGLGTRLQGTIGDLPKPLAPVAGRPFLAWLLDGLAQQGMDCVVLATGYRGERIVAALGNAWHGMELVYSREPEPRGTGGALALALARISGDSCFVLNGDTRLRLDYAQFAKCARTASARLAIAVSRVPDVARYGAVRVAADRVAGFIEKGHAGPGYINAGVYWLRRSLQSSFPARASFSLETDVLVPAVGREAVAAFTETSDFIDIGVPEDYQRAQAMFAAPGGTL